MIRARSDVEHPGSVAMRTMFRTVVAAICGALLAASPLAALSQTYPIRPILLIVPFAPGGSLELLSRLIGQKLSERLGQQVVVENRPGGAGNIAMEAAARIRCT